LVPWLVALSRLAFGPDETAARLPPVVFGVGGVLLAYAAGRRLFGREAGLAAAIVLGTALLHFALAWLLLLDMALAVTMSAALFCFLLGVREPPGPRRRGLFLALYAAAALATLAKGLIGVLLPGAVMFLWLLTLNQWHRLRPLYLPSGGAVFLLVAAPWHVLVAQRNPEWAQFYFVHEHWARFTTPVHGRAEPFWYFVPVLIFGLFRAAGRAGR
jgi:4-amino-4-deoxy-L-arabinose transferase-like glycosyltransferase